MTPLQTLTVRLETIQADLTELKHLARSTNGRVRKLEIWKAELKAELRGAKKAVGWIPPLATALTASAFTVLLYVLFLPH